MLTPEAVLHGHRIVIPAITYAGMQFGAIGKKASPRHGQLAFCARLDAVLALEREAVDARFLLRWGESDIDKVLLR